MTTKENQLAGMLLDLPQKSRARLAEKLISSLDVFEEDGVEAAWLKEAERRYQEIVEKKVKTKSAKKIFFDAYKKLR